MTDMLEHVAQAITAAELAWKLENGGDRASCVDCPDEVKARAAIGAMRGMVPVVREDGEVVHELRGSPAAIWATMLDAAVGQSEGKK